jgi:hypothetical protein
MAEWYKDIRAVINRKKTSTSRRARDGKVIVNSNNFVALPMSAHKEINDIIENECKIQLVAAQEGRSLDTLTDARTRAETLIPTVLNFANPKSLVDRVESKIKDSFGYGGARAIGAGTIGNGIQGGISNGMWMSGVNGQDPAMAGRAMPNLYISPGEAATIYSQKGIPEIIIRKKSHALLLNGVHITNPFLTPEQIEIVKNDMVKTGLAEKIAVAIRDGLVFSGSVLFPFFKNDSPLALTMPVPLLMKYGVIGKDCIKYWTTLDRWNTVHFPQYNPTAPDFLKPQYFYIPFLGADVHSSRISRIVPAPQAGYWGTMATMGWGVSDIQGWIESVFNYHNVMQSIPTMINQMSLLVRSFNVEGPLATEGTMLMEQIAKGTTMKVREASALNPVNMDVIGEIQAIQRDFKEVPQLTRLIRQDLAAKAGLVEELLFSSERGAFASGSDQSASWARQEENVRFMYTEVSPQLRPAAMLQVISSLGLDRKVLQALPFTQITFDAQKVVDTKDRTEILKAATKGFFDVVAGGMPLPEAAELIEQLTGGMVKISPDLLEKLRLRQEINDQYEEEAHNAEMKLATAQANKPAAGSSSASKTKDGEGHSYDDPLEQKKHERVRAGGTGTRKQGLAKARNKKV